MAVEKTEELVRLYDETSGTWKLVKKDAGPLRSVEIIERTLAKLGLSRNEVRVYLHLARYGERKASEISQALCLHRTETYRILRDLEKQGLISSIFEKPLKFIATPFEKAIDILIEARKLRIKLLERKKKNLVDIWFSLPHPIVTQERKEVFQILEGQEQVDLKANELLELARKEVVVFAPETDLSRLYFSGMLDKLQKRSKEIDLMILTNNSPKSRFFMEKASLDIRHASSDVGELPGFIIVDKSQLLLSILKNSDDSKENGHGKRIRITALSTTYGAFIKALGRLFEELWRSQNCLEVAPVTLA